MKELMRRVIGTSGSTSTATYTTKSEAPVNNPQQDKFCSKFSKNMITAIPHTNKRSHDSN